MRKRLGSYSEPRCIEWVNTGHEGTLYLTAIFRRLSVGPSFQPISLSPLLSALPKTNQLCVCSIGNPKQHFPFGQLSGIITRHWCESVDRSVTSVTICSRQVHEVELLVRNAVRIVDNKFHHVRHLKFTNVSSRHWPEAMAQATMPFLTSLDLSRSPIHTSCS